MSPALRVLVAERLRELAEEADLTRAERWQRAQAWASWEDEDNAAVEWDAVDAALPEHELAEVVLGACRSAARGGRVPVARID
jgi:siroheme synthase (precorrin-2 oxidase/ferrochelatase)